jgi:hypothetical protein
MFLATAELQVGICRATGFLFAEFKERVQLYLYFPLCAFVVCSRVNFNFTFTFTFTFTSTFTFTRFLQQ